MIWAAMLSAGVGPLCFLKSTVNAAIYQEILEHFMLSRHMDYIKYQQIKINKWLILLEIL